MFQNCVARDGSGSKYSVAECSLSTKQILHSKNSLAVISKGKLLFVNGMELNNIMPSAQLESQGYVKNRGKHF